MFRIGEFSKLTQVTIRMLRYYDEMGVLKPAQTAPWTGYHLYSVDQIPILNKIVFLKDTGINVAEIAVVLTSCNDDFVLEQLDNKYEEIVKIIQAEQENLRKIELAKKDITQEKNEMYYNVLVKAIPAYQILSLRKIIPNYYSEKNKINIICNSVIFWSSN